MYLGRSTITKRFFSHNFQLPFKQQLSLHEPLLCVVLNDNRDNRDNSLVSVSAMLVDTRQKNIAQVFILERYFFVSICPAASHGTCLAVFLAAVLLLC